MPEPTSLADHVELSTGFPFKSVSYSQNENDVRLVRGDNVVQGALRWDNAARWPISLLKSTSEYELKPGDVVLAMDRPWIEAGLKYARIGAADTPSLLVQRVSRLRAKSQLDQGFLFYLIGSQGFTDHVLAIQTGTAVPHISGKQILSFEFPLLDLPEQRAIAAVLGSLDNKIEQNRRTGRKLEELARAVFKAWFVDFEPVKAKAAGATAFPGMPPETFASLPNTLKDSPIGPVPEGWEVGTLSDIADVIMGTSPPSSTYNDEAIGVALINGPVEYGERFPLRLKWTTAPVKKASDGDLIFCVRGSTTGRRVISDGIYGLGRGVCAIRGKAASQPFVNALVDFDLPRLLGGTTGSVFPSLSAPTIKGFGIVSPPLVFIRAYCEHSARLLEAANSGARESAKLATLRDYLLPRLLSGRVRVAGAGIDAHAAAAGGADHDQGRHAARHDGDRLTARGSAAGRKAD